MSKDWVKDINEMQTKYGTREWVDTQLKLANIGKLHKFLEFRAAFLQEELDETKSALSPTFDPEEVVDGLIDLCVVAIGTLDAFGVDPYKAWDAVHAANMTKEVGVKASRPNPLGVPDLIKPEGWIAPSHVGNHGLLNNI
jgi:predicted HAD superfamily Cof-like phosphohydrolase